VHKVRPCCRDSNCQIVIECVDIANAVFVFNRWHNRKYVRGNLQVSELKVYWKCNIHIQMIAIPVEAFLAHPWVHQITLSSTMTHMKYERFWADKISLTSPLLIEIYVPNQKSERSFMCILRLSIFPQSIGIWNCFASMCIC
jgi:hypothetical protein